MSKLWLISAAALLALALPQAGGAKPRHAPQRAPKPPVEVPPAPKPPRHDWRMVSYTPQIYVGYLDLASIAREGPNGLTYHTLRVTPGNIGTPRPGAELVHHLSCDLMADLSVERVRAWPDAGGYGGSPFMGDGGGFLGGGVLADALNTACAGGDPAAAFTVPAFATTDAAYEDGAARMPGAQLPPMLAAPDEAPRWVYDAGASYLEIPGGLDMTGAALFLEVPQGRIGPGNGLVRLRSVVMIGPERMTGGFGGQVALVRMGLYDCQNRTVSIEMQGGYYASGQFSQAGGDLPPRGAAQSPALAVEIAAACAIAEGHPPPGPIYYGWRGAFDAARARWPAPAPDIASKQPGGLPPAPPRATGPIQHPDWMRKPSLDDISKYYPERAAREGLAGLVWLSCTASARGTLEGCSVVSEEPQDYGFGEAALKLSRFYKMRPATSDGVPVEGRTVRVPLNFHPN